MSPGFREEFDDGLDAARWLPHYLPHWSSRAESAATWTVEESALALSIPAEQGLWCADTHDGPLRVSGVQSGGFSGPVGSTTGQQPFAPGLVVREEQPLWTGWTWHGGLLEVQARMDLSPRSMASVWMIGLEDAPQRCGEICVFEVFGDAVDGTGAAIGQGVHPFRDPALVDDFAADHRPIDVTQWHTFAADWQAGHVDFLVDGAVTRTVDQSPDYPMQMMIAVFDFPDRGAGLDDHVPRLWVDQVRVA
ncbi:MAG: glycoside hydrolase family 16 protein [Aeromicrobium sp.]